MISKSLGVFNRYDQLFRVEATLDGEEGVFGIGRDIDNPDIVHLLGGDDGHWWVMGTYHKHWLPTIKELLNVQE